MSKKLFIAVVAIATSLFSVSFQSIAWAENHNELCNALAGSPLEPGNRTLGVAFNKITPDKAIAACQIALHHNPNSPVVQFRLGRALSAAKRDEEALPLYFDSANQNYASAQTALGLMYMKGSGVQKDYRIAFAWYSRAAKQGDANAQKGLGYLYANGLGTPKNSEMSLAWYQKSAAKGHASVSQTGNNSRLNTIEPTATRYATFPTYKDMYSIGVYEHAQKLLSPEHALRFYVLYNGGTTYSPQCKKLKADLSNELRVQQLGQKALRKMQATIEKWRQNPPNRTFLLRSTANLGKYDFKKKGFHFDGGFSRQLTVENTLKTHCFLSFSKYQSSMVLYLEFDDYVLGKTAELFLPMDQTKAEQLANRQKPDERGVIVDTVIKVTRTENHYTKFQPRIFIERVEVRVLDAKTKTILGVIRMNPSASDPRAADGSLPPSGTTVNTPLVRTVINNATLTNRPRKQKAAKTPPPAKVTDLGARRLANFYALSLTNTEIDNLPEETLLDYYKHMAPARSDAACKQIFNNLANEFQREKQIKRARLAIHERKKRLSNPRIISPYFKTRLVRYLGQYDFKRKGFPFKVPGSNNIFRIYELDEIITKNDLKPPCMIGIGSLDDKQNYHADDVGWFISYAHSNPEQIKIKGNFGFVPMEPRIADQFIASRGERRKVFVDLVLRIDSFKGFHGGFYKGKEGQGLNLTFMHADVIDPINQSIMYRYTPPPQLPRKAGALPGNTPQAQFLRTDNLLRHASLSGLKLWNGAVIISNNLTEIQKKALDRFKRLLIFTSNPKLLEQKGITIQFVSLLPPGRQRLYVRDWRDHDRWIGRDEFERSDTRQRFIRTERNYLLWQILKFPVKVVDLRGMKIGTYDSNKRGFPLNIYSASEGQVGKLKISRYTQGHVVARFPMEWPGLWPIHELPARQIMQASRRFHRDGKDVREFFIATSMIISSINNEDQKNIARPQLALERIEVFFDKNLRFKIAELPFPAGAVRFQKKQKVLIKEKPNTKSVTNKAPVPMRTKKPPQPVIVPPPPTEIKEVYTPLKSMDILGVKIGMPLDEAKRVLKKKFNGVKIEEVRKSGENFGMCDVAKYRLRQALQSFKHELEAKASFLKYSDKKVSQAFIEEQNRKKQKLAQETATECAKYVKAFEVGYSINVDYGNGVRDHVDVFVPWNLAEDQKVIAVGRQVTGGKKGEVFRSGVFNKYGSPHLKFMNAFFWFFKQSHFKQVTSDENFRKRCLPSRWPYKTDEGLDAKAFRAQCGTYIGLFGSQLMLVDTSFAHKDQSAKKNKPKKSQEAQPIKF